MVSVSVICPFTSNNRVSWSAKTIEISQKPQTRLFDQTKWHPTSTDNEIMDQHDHNEDDTLSISTPCEDPAMNQYQF